MSVKTEMKLFEKVYVSLAASFEAERGTLALNACSKNDVMHKE